MILILLDIYFKGRYRFNITLILVRKKKITLILQEGTSAHFSGTLCLILKNEGSKECWGEKVD